ncbi:MAG: ABC transporter permease, partial [bacterium]|nr:ABC transporter permease [bacterium]
MKSLLYLFRRYPLASVLNLSGLVLAFAGAYLLLTQIRFIDSYNRGIRGYEHIRRIYPHGLFNNDWSATLPRPFLERLKDCQQIESVGFMSGWMYIEFDKEGSTIKVPAYYANRDMLLTVNATCVDGELVCQPAGNGKGVVIPASLSEKYFGTVLATGKQMKARNSDEIFTVTGVYQDFPANSSMSNAVYIDMGKQNIDDPSNWNYTAFIRIRPDVDEQTFEANYQQMFKAYLQNTSSNLFPESAGTYIVAMPLCETYLNGHDPNTDRGNKTMLFIQKFAVLLLLLVLLINFANFTMAQAPTRLRSVNTRKVMGESNGRLRLRLVGESIVVSLVAWGLAMGMVYLIGRWGEIDNYILGSIQLQENGGIVLAMGGISMLVGVLASIY